MSYENVGRVVDEIVAINQVHWVLQQNTRYRHQRIRYRYRHWRRVVEVARTLLRRIDRDAGVLTECLFVVILGEVKIRQTLIVTEDIHSRRGARVEDCRMVSWKCYSTLVFPKRSHVLKGRDGFVGPRMR